MSRYVLALDQGTTSSRAILFDRAGKPCAVAHCQLAQHYPAGGWVEHDPEEIWTSQVTAAHGVLSQVDARPEDIAAIGIANQRETTILWDRETGEALHRAIVWQDRRTASRCERLNAAQIAEWTGLIPDSYFSATKLEWLLDNVPGARARAEAGKLAFGTVDSYLVWRLTEDRVHVTDVSNASRTMLFNLRSMEWQDDLIEEFRIPHSVLPTVVSSSGTVGETFAFGGRPIPISGIAGDQQAALFGQACFRRGLVKNTYGTGCFMLAHTDGKPLPSANRLLTTIAASSPGNPEYALEGSVFVAGAAVQWLRDEMGFIENSSDVEALAASVPDSGGVTVVPAFVGLGAPHWDSDARGAVLGITRGTSRAHIARATLESIAFQCRDVLGAMSGDLGSPVTEIRVDGGASSNNLLMQMQADIAGVPVVRPLCVETTALGAAYLAGLDVGFWSSISEIESQWSVERVFEPQMPPDQRQSVYANWLSAVRRVATVPAAR